jgi:PAS domain S-box-containing protein
MRSFEMAITPELSEQGVIESLLCISRDITERKQAELALQESEEQFRTFMQHAPFLAWIGDADGSLLYANPPFFMALGKTEPDLMGQLLSDRCPIEFAQNDRRHNQTVIKTDKILETIEVIGQPDGSEREYLVRKFPIHRRGQHIWVGGIAFDITVQRQAERVVRQSEERFRQLAETIQDVFFINSPDLSQLDYISPAYETVWGRL